jgi:hypothetical protein
MYSMKYLLIWAVFLVLFYIFLRWVIRRTPVTGDDDLKVRRISRLLERLNEKWNLNRK